MVKENILRQNMNISKMLTAIQTFKSSEQFFMEINTTNFFK